MLKQLTSNPSPGKERDPLANITFRPAILALLAVCAAGWVTYIHFHSPVLPYDDAFISYRFVDNFVAGKGLIYNAGERAWGYSTITYIFWLSAWRYLLPSVPLPVIAERANALPFAAVCVAVYFLVLRYTHRHAAAVAAAALIMFNAGLLGISTGGMEPFLFLAFALFSFLAADARRPLLAGLLAGLAVLTRIEGLVLVPILFVVIGKPRKAAVRMMVATICPPLAWLAFAHSFYGTYFPHAIIAKARPLYILKPLNACSRIVRYLSELFSAPGVIGGVSIFVFLILATIACVVSKRLRATAAWQVPMLFWSIFAAYACGNPLLFEWYYPQLFIPALITAVLGVSITFQHTSESPEWLRHRVYRAVGVLCSLWIIAATIHGWNALRSPYSPNWSVLSIDSEPGRLRSKAYKEAALWLNEVRGPHETVMAPEVGALGYYLNGSLIDTCGLVSPDAIRYLPVPASERLRGYYGSIPLAFVRDVQPDFIATLPVFGLRNVLEAPWAMATYHVVQEFRLPLPTYESDRVIILKRRDGSLTAGAGELLH